MNSSPVKLLYSRLYQTWFTQESRDHIGISNTKGICAFKQLTRLGVHKENGPPLTVNAPSVLQLRVSRPVCHPPLSRKCCRDHHHSAALPRSHCLSPHTHTVARGRRGSLPSTFQMPQECISGAKQHQKPLAWGLGKTAPAPERQGLS